MPMHEVRVADVGTVECSAGATCATGSAARIYDGAL